MTTPLDSFALFMLGLLGTGHCIGMCGPLVVALPGQTARLSAHLAYHAGRLATYSLVGVLMGAAGQGLIRMAAIVGGDPMIWMTRTQAGISVLAGIFLLFFGLARLGVVAEPRWLAVAMPNRMPGWGRMTQRPSDRRGNGQLFLLGVLLGGLPCGLSYAAFARALAAADAWGGGWAAMIFGLGTLPGLLAVGAGAGIVMRRFRRQADLLAGLIMIGMAAMLLINTIDMVDIRYW